MESSNSKSNAHFMHGRDECKHADNLSHAMWCAMSEDDDNTNFQEDHVHTHLSGVSFLVHCVGLGCHVVIGVGRHVVRFHHAYAIPSFLLDVVVRLYLVIVNSNFSHNYCLLHIAKTGHLRCCPYIRRHDHVPMNFCVRDEGTGGVTTISRWLLDQKESSE